MKTLEEVYHVDGLKHNRLSISQVFDKENKVTFNSIRYKVKKLNIKKIMLTAKRHTNVKKDDVWGVPSINLTCLSAIECDTLFRTKDLVMQV